jgi:thioredoxin 1
MAMNITDANFKELVNGEKPVMIDFWAEWCGPCRMITPIVEELAEEYEGKAIVGKINVDENDEIPSEYGIRSIPTILFFKGGELVDKQVGAASKSKIEEKLKAII